MKLLSPCPDKAKCYIYRVRSGDNLFSIANYFGVSLGTVKAWNTWTESGLKAERELRIPPPTR
jgi:LysM repeat protein